jgi:hypothetical protein
MAGRFNFQIPGRPDASIVNMGTITATNGGFAALVAPGVRNSGTITANLGSIALGAGNIFTLDFYGDKLITLGVGDQIASQVKDVATGQPLSALVKNEGILRASGGRVELTAAAARHVVDSVINTSGIIEANSVGMRNGQIVLSAATADTKGNTPRQTVRVSGALSAAGIQKGSKGGKVVITGENIELKSAGIDASGRAGGGTVMVGGDWGGGKPNRAGVNNQSAALDGNAIPNATTVSVDAASTIDASARDGGNGGKVVLWADDRLSFAGTILALGGKSFGDGGFVETSGKHHLDFLGDVNTRAWNGKNGTLLLDPENYTIWTGVGPAPAGSSITNTLLNSQLASGDVIIQTNNAINPPGQNGDIIVGAAVNWSSNTTLTLNAFRDVVFNFIGGPNITNTGGGNLVVRADSTGANNTGSVIFNAGTTPQRIDWSNSTGKVTFFYNPSSYAIPTNFTTGVLTNPSVPEQFTANMWVHNATNLASISTNLAGRYALSQDINAGSIPNFAPIGGAGSPFTGRLDGQNFTISNLTIAPVAPSATSVSIGMFGTIGATGHVSNLTITNANVTANPNVTGPGQFVGILAGSNGGTVSNVTVDGTVSHGTANNGVVAGGLIGQNAIFGPGASAGAIVNSLADVTVTVGNATSGSQGNSAGGLVGGNPGAITNSIATGDVSGGANSFIGGLVGRNETAGTITGSGLGLSGATGNVTISDATGSGAGGFVGFNFGTISGLNVATGNVTGGNSSDIFKAGSFGGFVGLNDAAGQISGGVAGGNVSAGAKSAAGGFVGFNNGTISGSAAGGSVTSQENAAGGFAAFNGGTISGSTAVGNVSGGGFSVGGFVGSNSGTITNSSAIGTVNATLADGDVGGFTGTNNGTISGSQAFGNVTGAANAGGFAGSNDNNGSISNSFAFGSVTVGNSGTAGGFISGNNGTITNSQASGAVTGGSNSYLGGFAAGNFGTIENSTATGNVTATGANSVAGGFAGVSFDKIANSTAFGAVSGTSNSYLGGFVGINVDKIVDSTSSGNVSGSGASNIVGGFAGMNFGNIDPSHSTGNASSGANSVVGGFAGANGALQFPNGFQLVGVISPDSTGSGTANGGAGSTVGTQVGQNYPTGGVPDLPADTCQRQGGDICGGTLFRPGGGDQHHDVDVPNTPQQSPLLNLAAQFTNDVFTEKKPDEVIKTSTPGTAGSSSGPSGQKGGGQSAGNAGRPPINVVPPVGLGPLPSGMPPINETRFASNEVVMQLGLVLSQSQIEALQRQFGLEVISTQRFDLLGRTAFRFRLTGGADVRAVIAGIQGQIGAKVSVQPSYTFTLDQGSGAPANQGDSAQYIVAKLGLVEAHGIATGKNVKVAVIDSEIDSQHPDLTGVIAGNFDALPSTDQTPHPHGTGMAGAIGSNQRLLGTAPGARILGVRAFGVSDTGAQGTSMNIVKGLEWAVQQGAQVINMSFAGPRDPILEQAIKSLKDRGIIMIAATGNAGPKSPPLFPGADPNVIGVSATDVDDKTYKNAVRGKQVAIAAPGVDILVPAPAGGYQLTTGTSVAAAHISGVVALMLERNPRLTPNDVRAILSATAKKLPQGRNEIGAGLVDPVQALSKAGPKQAQAH